jgi:hypothetical protein
MPGVVATATDPRALRLCKVRMNSGPASVGLGFVRLNLGIQMQVSSSRNRGSQVNRKTYTREEVLQYLDYLAEQVYLNRPQLEDLLTEFERRWLPEQPA